MDGNHPKDIDPRPKRRRAKDNPYEIYTVGIHTDQPHYFIAFTDYGGVHHEIEIDKALFETLNRFELDDLSFLNEVDNHYERSELTYEQIAEMEGCKYQTVQESIYAALKKLKKILS